MDSICMLRNYRKHMFVYSLFLLALLCNISLAAVPRVYRRQSALRIGVCQTPPRIDGKVQDKVWQTAAGACFATSQQEAPGYFMAAYDKANLYFAVRAINGDMGNVVCQQVERESDVYRQETIELFVSPKYGSNDYYQFAVTPLNDRSEVKFINADGNIKWSGHWESGVSQDANGWWVEVRIPLKTIEMKYPDRRMRISFNVCRTERTMGSLATYSSFSAKIGGYNFHQYSSFATMRFSSKPGGVFVKSLGDGFAGRQKIMVRNGAGPCVMEVAIRNNDEFRLLRPVGIAQGLSLGVPYSQELDDSCISMSITQLGDEEYASGFIEFSDNSFLPRLIKRIGRRDQSGEKLTKDFKRVAHTIRTSKAPMDQRRAYWDKAKTQLALQAMDCLERVFCENAPVVDSASKAWGYVVCSSMIKVLPKRLDMFKGDLSGDIKSINLFAAKGEMEAAQIVVYAKRTLKCLSTCSSDLANSNGEIIPSNVVKVAPVGFVKTKDPKLYNVAYVGWWPDPILHYLGQHPNGTFVIPGKTLMPLWFSVKVPRNQPPGIYKGEVTVRFRNATPLKVPVTVRVRNFALPEEPSLPTAFSTSVNPTYRALNFTEQQLEAMQAKYDRFAAEHRLNPGSIYNFAFNSYFGVLPNEKSLALWKKLNVRAYCISQTTGARRYTYKPSEYAKLKMKIQPSVNAARMSGMLDKAFFYGWDEWTQSRFSELRELAKWYKKTWPEIPIMTTARDLSYGRALPEIDWFCPEIYQYSLAQAEDARRRGKKVWTYTCIATKKPYPSHFIEYPAIDNRLIVGFMAHAYRFDGYLYYSTIRPKCHNHGKTLSGGPYLEDWDPRSWRTANGDGLLIYPRLDGPVTSIRLENILDGMEDYEYVILAKRNIEHLKRNGKTVLAEKLSKSLAPYLSPGNDVVHSLREYTNDPQLILKVRKQLAAIIEAK